MAKAKSNGKKDDEVKDCFVIMPITDPEGYSPGHFQHVFDDLFIPACKMAGFHAVRADSVKETNLIHLDVLQKLLDSPMAICDLSSRNPNVLFELGLRQAFDKPVVLVQEKGTPKIFDIAPLRYTEYRRARVYHEVLEDQKAIRDAITSTEKAFSAGKGINSIVKILSLTQPAALTNASSVELDPVMQLIRAEIAELRQEFRNSSRRTEKTLFNYTLHDNDSHAEAVIEVSRIEKVLDDIKRWLSIEQSVETLLRIQKTLLEISSRITFLGNQPNINPMILLTMAAKRDSLALEVINLLDESSEIE